MILIVALALTVTAVYSYKILSDDAITDSIRFDEKIIKNLITSSLKEKTSQIKREILFAEKLSFFTAKHFTEHLANFSEEEFPQVQIASNSKSKTPYVSSSDNMTTVYPYSESLTLENIMNDKALSQADNYLLENVKYSDYVVESWVTLKNGLTRHTPMISTVELQKEQAYQFNQDTCFKATETLNKNSPYNWCNVSFSTNSEKYISTVLSPIFYMNKFAGVTGINVDLKKLADSISTPIKTADIPYSDKTEFILYSKGQNLLFSNISEPYIFDLGRQSKDTIINAILRDNLVESEQNEITRLISDIFLNSNKTFRSGLLNGEEYYVIKDSNNDSDWVIIALVNHTTAHSTLEETGLKIKESNRNVTYMMIIIAILLSSLGVYFISLYTGRIVTSPLLKLRKAVESIGGGKTDIKVELDHQSELSELANAITEMSTHVGASLNLSKSLSEVSSRRSVTQAYLTSISAWLQSEEIWVHLINNKSIQTSVLKDGVLTHSEALDSSKKEQLNSIRDHFESAERNYYYSDEGPMRWLHLKLKNNDDVKGFVSICVTRFDSADLSQSSLKVLESGTTEFLVNLDRAELYESLEDQIIKRTVELQTAKDIAELNSKSKSIFLANISHELRTPLNAISGFSQMLMTNETVTTDVQSRIQSIFEATTYLSSIVDDVLDMSTIESGQIEIKNEPFNLRSTLDKVSSDYAMRIEGTGLDFTYQSNIAPETAIIGDRLKILKVLNNLLSNAIKFTEKGSIKFIANVTNGTLEVDIEDSGIGISESAQKEIFNPFARAKSSKHIKGTGLGLSISKQLADMMNGNLSVKSVVGRGSIFTFKVPVDFTKEVHDTSVHVKEFRLDQSSSINILCADDIEANLEIISSILETAGVTVFKARNGKEAVNICANKKIDLVFMDVSMPVMDGNAAVTVLKNNKSTKNIKCVALTAHALEHQRESFLSIGYDDFIAKPYVFGDIFQIVENHLNVTFIKSSQHKRQNPSMTKQSNLEELVQFDNPPSIEVVDEILKTIEIQSTKKLRRLLNAFGETDTHSGTIRDICLKTLESYDFDKISKIFELLRTNAVAKPNSG